MKNGYCAGSYTFSNIFILQVVQLIRDCVWNYLRDHVPSPALFSRDENGLMWRDATLARPEPQYTNTLRSTMQNNIQYLGILYSQLFLPTLSGCQND
jgi:hypothetical protein